MDALPSNFAPETPQRNVGRFLSRRANPGRFSVTDALTYFYLIAGVLIMFGPVLWLLMSSFKPRELIFEENPTFLPYGQQTYTADNEALFLHDLSVTSVNLYAARVGGARITERDLEATNGFVHGTTELLVPPEAAERLRNLDISNADTSLVPEVGPRTPLEGDTGNVYEVANASVELTVIMQYIAMLDLETQLADTVTLVLPTNSAMDRFVNEFEEENVAAMLQDHPDLLEEIILHNILQGSFNTLDLYRVSGQELNNLREIPLSIDVSLSGDSQEFALFDVTFKALTIGDAQAIRENIMADNGRVYVVDRVLVSDGLADAINALDGVEGQMPAGVEAAEYDDDGTLLDVAFAQADATIMAQIFEVADVEGLLRGDETYALVLPSDEAFAAFVDEFGQANVAALFQSPALLTQLLHEHILIGNFVAEPETFRGLTIAWDVEREHRSDIRIMYRNFGDDMLNFARDGYRLGLTETGMDRLARVGPPDSTLHYMIDPDEPEIGVTPVTILSTSRQEETVGLDPVREIEFSLDNYTGGVEAFDFWTYLRNSVIVTIAATVITLIINSMAAFALSKYKFRGRDVVFVIIISTLMVPVSVILVPAFLVISEIGWHNNLWGVIIPGAATPTGVFLLRQYMLTIPDELLDSARIDGATEWRIYWQIVLPLARPALAVLAIFSVMWRWNDFLWPLIVLNRNELFTLQVGLRAFQGALDIQWHYILAMTVLTLLPITLVFAFLQRYITGGIATTGMKG